MLKFDYFRMHCLKIPFSICKFLHFVGMSLWLVQTMFYVIFVDEMEGEVKEGLEGHEKTRNMRGDNEDRAWKDVKYAQQMLNLHWWQNKTVSAQTSWSAASMLVQNKKWLKIIPLGW